LLYENPQEWGFSFVQTGLKWNTYFIALRRQQSKRINTIGVKIIVSHALSEKIFANVFQNKRNVITQKKACMILDGALFQSATKNLRAEIMMSKFMSMEMASNQYISSTDCNFHHQT